MTWSPTGTQLQRPVDHASYAAVRSSHAVRQDLGFLWGRQRVCLDCYFAVWMFIHRLGFWWFWWFWMLLDVAYVARLQISDTLRSSCPPYCCIFDAFNGTSAHDILPWLMGRFSGISGYPPLHPTVSAAVADLSSGSTCGATRAFAAGFEGLGSWRRSCGYEMLRGKTNPTNWVWKHPQIDHLLYFPQTHSFIPNSTDFYVSISLGMALFVFCRAEPEQNRTAGTQPWNLLLGCKSWVHYNLYIYIMCIYI